MSTDLNLEICAREPIHIPSLIQPHGGLLAFDPSTAVVSFASENLGSYFRLDAIPVIGRSIVDFFGESATQMLLDLCFTRSPLSGHHKYLDIKPGPDSPLLRPLQMAIHVYLGTCVVEFEDQAADDRNWLDEFSDTLDALQSSRDVPDLLNRMAIRFRDLSGFDRVMVYRFDENWDGHVIAEAVDAEMESFLDLHYPASDIPAQARELYRKNMVRYIANVDYAALKVEPWEERLQGSSLDMSHCLLRSISPVHIQYLKNMGVGSTLTISLMVEGRLWGLIACHHRHPTHLALKFRCALEPLAFSLGHYLASKVQRESAQARSARSLSAEHIMAAFSQPNVNLSHIIEMASTELLKLGHASGGALWDGTHIYSFGRWPGPDLSLPLIQAVRSELAASGQSSIFMETHPLIESATHHMQRQFCGLAAIKLSSAGASGLIWLRPEMRQETRWGGDPNKPVQVEKDANGKILLSPRNSFGAWVTSEQGKSRRWTEADRAAINSLQPLQQVLTIRESLHEVMRSNRQFRSLVNLQSDAYWQTDRKGKILVMSKSILPDVAIRKDDYLHEVFSPYIEAEASAALNQLLMNLRPFKGHELASMQGVACLPFKLGISGEAILDVDGIPIGMHGTIQLLTKQRVYEEGLMKMKLAAEVASRAKSNFLAIMSHEMRTPLNVIIGITDLMDKSGLSDGQRDDVNAIQTASNALLQIVNDTLDVSKIEANEFKLNTGAFSVPALIDEIETMFMQSARSSPFEFRIECQDQQFSSPVIGDADRIRQVLVNLIGNAFKFTHSGHVILRVAGQAVDAEGRQRLTMEVEDSGIGMSESFMQHLFDPFVQADASLNRKFGGTGLGLSIVKRVLELMGGTIEVRSEVGHGSRFLIDLTLPVAQAVDSEGPIPAAELPNADFSKLRIMLVDDSAINLHVAGRMIKRLGARAIVCGSGEAALKLLRSNPDCCDLILMDLQMPEMDGCEATKRIRDELHLALPIIALTAAATTTEMQHSTEAGMNGFLTKPIDPDLLKDTLAKHSFVGGHGSGAMLH